MVKAFFSAAVTSCLLLDFLQCRLSQASLRLLVYYCSVSPPPLLHLGGGEADTPAAELWRKIFLFDLSLYLRSPEWFLQQECVCVFTLMCAGVSVHGEMTHTHTDWVDSWTLWYYDVLLE